MATVTEILQNVGSIIDQDTTLPTGTDLLVRIALINQAQAEWERSYSWKEIRINRYPIPVADQMVSVALPSTFKKLMSRPFDMSKTTNNDYEEIRPEQAYLRISQDLNNRFCFTGGNKVTGKYINFNPAIASGASIVFDYQSAPVSVATLNDVPTCPSDTFITKKVIAKIYESRADTRFPQFLSEANDTLANLMDEEAALSGGTNNTLPTFYDNVNFRMGR